MKKSRLIAFLSVFFVFYGLINIYIHAAGVHALSFFASDWGISCFNAVFIFMVFSYPVARITGKWLPGKVADFLAFVGGMWFAGILYFLLAIISLEVIGFIFGFIPMLDSFIVENIILANVISFVATVSLVIILIVLGYINAISPRIKKVNILISKPDRSLKDLHVVFASDIHLGHIIGQESLKRILENINKLNPDLVLFPGDLVDEELKPVIDKNLGELFRLLKPKYGVYAVTGNHEYIGGVDQAVKYLSQFGIKFLRDEVIKVDNSFYIAGREDVSVTSFFGKKRKAVSQLLTGIDAKLPIIMMDHQPIALGEASEYGVDLQVSGHTHHGQMWPLQAITKRVFKLSWGYKKIRDSHFYVSSGVGSWGPRVRLGNHPEIVSLKLKFAHIPKERQD